MDRALELGREYRSPRIGRWPDIEHARQALWAGHLDRAREIFLHRQSAAARSGIEFQRPLRAMDMTFVELAAGQLAVAAELVGDGLESALDAGSTSIAMWLRYPDGLVHAHLGTDDERVRQAVAELRAWGDDRGEEARVMTAHHVAGVFALARDDAETALGELRHGAALARQMGFAHPGVIPVLPDVLEAAAATGATELARELAAELESQAAALGLPWVDAAATRGRGLASLAAGEPAADDLAEAAAAFDALGYRLDAARAWWWHGRALQRAGRRRPAADVLAEARDRFAALGAAPWAALAATDLERVAPGRATGALTDDETRIAELVAHGRRNREIAAELFVSVATVEAHLTRIYRKLGVRSRTELSRRVVESSR
jgi:DNA-binding CsgD family transcriptional regulator